MLDPFCKINYNNNSYLFMNDDKSLALCDMSNVDISTNSNKIKSFCYFFDFDKYESLINNNEYKKLSDKQKYKKLLKNEDYYYRKTNIPCTYIKKNNNLFVNTKISNNNNLYNRYNIVKIKDNVNLNDFTTNYLKNMNDINYKNNNNNNINNYIDIIKSQKKNNNNINYYYYFKKYFIIIIIFLLFVTIIIIKYFLKIIF